MITMNDVRSREIQAAVLKRRYPKVEALLLNSDEVLLSVSERKPLRMTGFFYIVIGVIVAVQISVHFLLSHPHWSVPLLVASVICMWAGVWLIFFTKNECVFVTDRRLVHLKVDLVGRSARIPLSIDLSDISEVHLYRNSLMLGGRNNTSGDILVKKKVGGTYLVPSLMDSVGVSEILMTELSFFRAKKAAVEVDHNEERYQTYK